ncbi:MAG: hypothetical protein DKT66_22775 [Candidatus Melainabacteria bacterium]|nr:MAG: hypothetical protein DKT66_22775 [Candidatus Melainabacteria bacterium]
MLNKLTVGIEQKGVWLKSTLQKTTSARVFRLSIVVCSTIFLSGCSLIEEKFKELMRPSPIEHPGQPQTGQAEKRWPEPPHFTIPPPTKEELAEVGLPVPPTFFVPPPQKPNKKVRGRKNPVKFEKKTIDRIPFYQTTIDLTDYDTYLSVLLPHNASQANSAEISYGAENFESFVTSHKGAVLMNGTFFSKDKEQRVMGNLVADGKILKYSRWENYGTTLGIRADNKLEMVTARAEGQPQWDKHWFSLTCGPRLLRQGEVWVHPDIEGFTDSHVLTIGPRQAMGYPKSKDKIYLVTFLYGLSLEKEAEMMKKIGCYEAMNLDGGASRALAHNGSIIIKAGRPLTNVLIVYDKTHPAPQNTVKSWDHFQEINQEAEESGD